MKHIILIPTYNESENIEHIITLIMSIIPSVYIKVIDDNSPDGTANIVKSMMNHYSHLSLLMRQKKEGLGRAYTHGFKEVLADSEATHVIMMDADLSHNPKDLPIMIELSKQYDLVVGSRYIREGGTVGWELWRKMLSYFGNIYAGLVSGVPVHDMTGGFNCIHVSQLKKIDLDTISSSGYAFIMELKYALHKSGARVIEFPIIFNNRIGGESKISNHIISEGILAPWKMILKK